MYSLASEGKKNVDFKALSMSIRWTLFLSHTHRAVSHARVPEVK